jgi:hypothetical protein
MPGCGTTHTQRPRWPAGELLLLGVFFWGGGHEFMLCQLGLGGGGEGMSLCYIIGGGGGVSLCYATCGVQGWERHRRMHSCTAQCILHTAGFEKLTDYNWLRLVQVPLMLCCGCLY